MKKEDYRRLARRPMILRRLSRPKQVAARDTAGTTGCNRVQLSVVLPGWTSLPTALQVQPSTLQGQPAALYHVYERMGAYMGRRDGGEWQTVAHRG